MLNYQQVISAFIRIRGVIRHLNTADSLGDPRYNPNISTLTKREIRRIRNVILLRFREVRGWAISLSHLVCAGDTQDS